MTMVIGCRNDMLRALGNGVVPHQAARALRILLAAHTCRLPQDPHDQDDDTIGSAA